jgi:hypothetical protein
MSCVIVTLLCVLLVNATLATAQDGRGQVAEQSAPQAITSGKPGSQEDTDSEHQGSILAIVGKAEGKEANDFRFKMGETLQIRVAGDLATKIRADLAEAGASKNITLYFDGVRMTDMKSTPIQLATGKELRFNFDLVRDPTDDGSRKAWDTLLKKKRHESMTIQPSLAVGHDLPLEVQSAYPFRFYVASRSAIGLAMILGLAALVGALYLLVACSKALRDSDTGPYSLGKSQMAFWGLLVLLSFLGVWALTGTMERIPPQVLILIGISGATGLWAAVIGDSKKSEITKLRLEEKMLQKRAVPSGALSPEDRDRLVVVKAKIDELSRSPEQRRSTGFFQDICCDSDGLSFHRLQVVMWTIVLGAVFVDSVIQAMSMPEFPEAALTLLGISNGTYLGFKFRE